MTCIVGIAHQGKVYMGGDRGMSDETFIKSMMKPKIKRNGSLLIGYAANLGTGQLAQMIQFPEPPTSNLDTYMRTDFVRALKDAYEYYSIGVDVHDSDKAAADLLVGVHGCLFEVYTDDWSVGEYNEVASGSGASYAMGSLYSTREWDNPKQRVREAVHAAIKYSPSCQGPVDVLVL